LTLACRLGSEAIVAPDTVETNVFQCPGTGAVGAVASSCRLLVGGLGGGLSGGGTYSRKKRLGRRVVRLPETMAFAWRPKGMMMSCAPERSTTTKRRVRLPT